MNILYIVPYVPSLVRVRPYHLIRGLSKRGHKVTVLTLWTNQAEREELQQLRAEAYAVEAEPLSRLRPFLNTVKALPTSEPLQAAYCWQPALAEELRRIAVSGNGGNPFDIVHVEHLRGARYGL
ncbi:MAG: glycosyl transferase family 1, partial [Anaerolineales bacterium]